MAAEQNEPRHCDRDCTELATHAYQFDWGETGICCAKHATLLTQTAGNLQRTIQVSPLQNLPPPPLQRDERTQLHAARISLETELEEVKSRGLELYRLNGEQQRTINTLTVQKRELEAVVKDLTNEATTLRGQLEMRDGEHAELVIEIERLRGLEQLLGGLTEPNKGHVVEGGSAAG
jgi:hypothetical protein